MISRAWAFLLCLCLSVPGLFAAQLRAAEPTQGAVKIEMPLFEGGAGKDFSLECARDYELTGAWDVQLAGDRVATFRDGKFTLGEWGGTYRPVRAENQGQRWNLTSEQVVGSIVATPTRLSGAVVVRNGGSQRTEKLTGVNR